MSPPLAGLGGGGIGRGLKEEGKKKKGAANHPFDSLTIQHRSP